MAGESDVGRELRSKRNVKDQESGKFNFDVEEFEIPTRNQLKVVSSGKSQSKPVDEESERLTEKKATDKDALYGLEEKSQKIRSMILEIKNHHMEVVTPGSCNDMLPDSLYSSFHKLMLRQEGRMLEMDVVEGEVEAERLHLLREKLDLIHWPITLRKVTVVNNPNDDAEMLRKKELTKQCIDSMLDKFEAMKSRSSILARNYKRDRIDPSKDLAAVYNRIDRRRIVNYHSSSDDEEEELSAEQTRIHRRQKRQEQCRGSIIIQSTLNPLGTKARYAIVAEPLRKPYVVKVSLAERNAWKKHMSNAHKKFKYRPRLADQVAVFQRKVQIPLTLTVAAQEATDRPPTIQTPPDEAPTIQAPPDEAPTIQVPAIQIPVIQVPAVQVPTNQVPSEQTPNQVTSGQEPLYQVAPDKISPDHILPILAKNLKEADDRKRKALSICDKVTNGLSAIEEKLIRFHNNIHSPPLRKKRKKQE